MKYLILILLLWGCEKRKCNIHDPISDKYLIQLEGTWEIEGASNWDTLRVYTTPAYKYNGWFELTQVRDSILYRDYLWYTVPNVGRLCVDEVPYAMELDSSSFTMEREEFYWKLTRI